MLTSLVSRIEVRTMPWRLVPIRQTQLSQQWNSAELCGVIVGTGAGKAFCAGGDVASTWPVLDALVFLFTGLIFRHH